MRHCSLFILLLFSHLTFGQGWKCRYPSHGQHAKTVFVFNGDTVNRQNRYGEYIGLHLYTNQDSSSEITSYILGEFKNGIPVGLWHEQCEDGSFSKGAVKANHFFQGSKIIEVKNVIADKVGIWKYYDKNGKLFQLERYDTKNTLHHWTDKSYRADSSGKFILIRNEGQRDGFLGLFYKEFRHKYSDTGLPIHREIYSFFKQFQTDYHENGVIKEHRKYRQLFGRRNKWLIVKKYDQEGHLTERNRIRVVGCH